MVREGESTGENLETEVNPESALEQNPEQAVTQTVEEGVAEVEKKDDKNSPGLWQKNKKKILIGAIAAPIIAYELPRFIIFATIYRFAKKLIEKKGHITFKEGFEIGEDVFSLGENKKSGK